jgi:hypothetical protein
MAESSRDHIPAGPVREEARIADRLSQLQRRYFVGRQRELKMLGQCIDPDGPAVTFLHGIGGMGKSALLTALALRLQERGVRSVYLDARSFAPTPRGFWQALASELGLGLHRDELTVPESEASPTQVAAALASAGPGLCVLMVDHYEHLRLLDAWLRQDLAPQLPARVRLILSGRHPPTADWSTTLGWQPLLQSCALQALDETESRALLEARRAPPPLVPGIVKFAQGHPLALELALAAAAERPGFDFEAPDRSRVIARLAQLFLQDLPDSRARTALEAACVVRRASRSFLASLLGEDAAIQTMERLGELGFIERTADGLSLHPSVRQALEGELQAIDPHRHRELRRAAWHHMRQALPSAGRAQLWPHAADALFLLEQDLVRDAFFPTARDVFVVERAQDRDWSDIASLCSAYDSANGIAVIGAFFRHARHAVHVARSERGEVAAFYVLLRSDLVPQAVLDCDALIRAWVEHHSPSDAPALLLRRLLADPTRATRAEAYAACVLDFKRTYIENPNTSRLYAAASAVTDHPEWGPLGFREQPGLASAGLARNGGPHSTFCLDFGAGGIFGWIGRLLDAQYESPEWPEATSRPAAPEPGLASEPRFGLHIDVALRRLLLDGSPVTLTPLQFNLLQHLSNHSARVVDRDELVQAVWGVGFVGSNVVDAAIRSLRKRLGAHADAIETVKGFGYRFRASTKPS